MAKRIFKRKRSQSKKSKGVGESDNECFPDTPVEHKKVRWDNDADDEHQQESSSESDKEGQEEVGKVCLAAWCQNGRVACAFVDRLQHLVYVLEDTQEDTHYDLTKMVLDHAQPEIILTSSRSDDKFIDTLRIYADGSGSMFQIRPHKDFNPTKGRDRVLSLRLLSDLPSNEMDPQTDPDVDQGFNIQNAYDFMKPRQRTCGDPATQRRNASIRLSNFASADTSPLCIAAVGALIDHLVRERAMSDLEDEGISGLDIRDIEMLTLEAFMQINADTLFSLQIFNAESHASVHSDRTKEGLSLFGVLNNTKSALGRSLLRTWLLRPSLSIPVIVARQDAVECFLRPENLATAETMHDHLKGIQNMHRKLATLRRGRGKLSDWQALVKFTIYASLLRDALNELHSANKIEIVRKLVTGLEVSTFKEIGNTVNEIIDWEDSIIAGRVCVRPHVDEELDNRKNIYYGIDSVLSKVAEQICEIVPADYASSLNVVYFPQLGFLVCIPMLEEWRGEGGIKALDGWTFQFSSESHVYFKSQEMRDMDIHIGDLHSTIVDREIEIVQHLLDTVLVYQGAIDTACDICAELDCLLAFSQASRAYEYRRPRIVEENIIEIVAGRHPLFEQAVETFVPNDARVRGGASIGPPPVDTGSEEGDLNSIILCTGANGCGKSVYLKQIALIQVMAQVGCFVPAESATLGVVDKIFTRIATRESVSKVQSAFMIDLNQVSLALRNSTARSLVLLDEFGKGTLSTDGAALFWSVLKHLLDRGSDCPKVLAATHFYDIFRLDLLDLDSLPITFLHMEILFTSRSGQLPRRDDESDAMTRDQAESITYLYRVSPGLSLNSHAAQCAELFGIPLRVVDRARYVSMLISTHEIGKLLDEGLTEDEIRDLEEAEAVCRKFLTWDFQNEENLDVRAKLREVLGKQAGEELHDVP